MKTKPRKTRTKIAKQPSSTDDETGGNIPARFELKDSPANEVFVAGDFNGWNSTAVPLEHNGDGVWSAEIELPPGRHEYLFVADGSWLPDPVAESVPNSFGGVNSVVTVPR